MRIRVRKGWRVFSGTICKFYGSSGHEVEMN
jgi:hypothetical protein